MHRVVHRLDPGELRLSGSVFLLRRGKFLLPGGIVGLALLELRLPGGILRFGRGELFAAGVILRLPALEPALADVIRHDARSKRELERVIRLLLRAEGRRQLAERAGAAAQLRIGGDTVGPLLLRAHDAPRRHGHDEHRRREQHPAGRAARRGQQQAALRRQRGPAHEGIAQQQKLRQHEQHEKHSDKRPDAHEPAHAGHCAGRDARADEQAGGDEHRAGGDDGREGEVQRRDHGLARALIGARLGIVRGDDDRIVHVAAHLNGAGHEIDHEEHILAREHRDAEVDPDAALNDEREQNGHTERAEREQQHEHDHEDGHGADHDVVLRERLLGPVGGHGVADEIAVGGVVLVHDGVDAVEQGKRLVPVRGRGKREHETMVRRALELRAGALELAAERRDLRRLRGAERDGAVGDLVIQEFEQLQQRHLIAAQILRGRLRGAVFGRVEREERLRARAVHVAELRERPVIDRVRQPVAAGRLQARNADGALDLRHGREGIEQRGLLGIIPGRDDDGQHRLVAEIIRDRLRRGAVDVRVVRFERRFAVNIAHAVGADARHDEHGREHQRHHAARPPRETADARDLRHEVAVLRLIHGRAELEQQPRHEQEHRQHADQDRLDEHDAEVAPEAELHERHGDEARNGRQARGADDGNGFFQRLDGCLAHRQRLMRLLVAVAENDGVVHRHGQLQQDGHGVGHERDRAENEVRALVDERRREERDEQDGHLGIRRGREREHRDEDDRHDDEQAAHLAVDLIGDAVALGGINVRAAAVEQVAQGLHGLRARVRPLQIRQADAQQRAARIVHRVRAAVHPVDRADLLRRGRGGVRVRVAQEDLRRPVGLELLLHDVQPLPRLGISRQIGRNVVFDLHPAGRDRGKDQQRGKDDENSR